MGAKLLEKEIIDFLNSYGCVLVSPYNGVNNNIKIIASCGHNHIGTLTNMRRSVKNIGEIICNSCARLKYNGKRNDDFSNIIKYLNINNCEYIGFKRSSGRVYINYIAQCGHEEQCDISVIKRDNFTFLCKECSKRLLGDKYKLNIEKVAQLFKENNCELLDKNYLNYSVPLLFKCECGNASKISLASLLAGHRCGCGLKRISGPNSHLYNPMLTDEERELSRKFPEYSQWRKAVFEKDNYTCQCCEQFGGSLSAHHINNYKDYPEQRLNVNNGITLCWEGCHTAFHQIYGKENNTKEQLEEFIKLNQEFLKEVN